MKKILLAAGVFALACTASPALSKEKKDKDAAKIEAAIAKISAPEGPLKPIVATWPVGVSPTTPTIAADAALPSNTEIVLKMNSELNSKKAKEGDTFIASVAHDVMLGNVVVIPKGAPAYGVVTWRTGKGAFGKSAKMNYEFKSLELNGQRVPLSGQFRQEGRGNTGAAVGAAVAVGVFGAFVTGKSAIVEQGQELKVYTITAIPVQAPVIPPVPVAAN